MTDDQASDGQISGDGDESSATGDPLTALAGSDHPVDPRPEFATSLYNRLCRLADRPLTGGSRIGAGTENNNDKPSSDNQHGRDHDHRDTSTHTDNKDNIMNDQSRPSPTNAGPDYLADLDGVSNLLYFTMPAPDIDRAKEFYRTVLGWQVEGGSLGGHVVNVTPPGGLDPTATTTDTHTVYLTVFDLDAAMAKVRELGGAVERTVDDDTGRMASCRDDQGTMFCLQEPSDAYLDHARNPAKGTGHGDLYHFFLPVPDGDAGRRFYHGLLGWDFGPPGSAGGMHAENMITDGGIGAGRSGHGPEFWFRVDDLTASIEVVRSAGGTASDPMDTPQGATSQCTDDQGVKFGLIQPVTVAAGIGDTESD